MNKSVWMALALVGLVACSPAVEDTPVIVEEEVNPETISAPPAGMDIAIFALNWENGLPFLGERMGGITRPGYDNQPFFTPDGTALLYSSANDGENNDIWRLDLVSGETINLTNTPDESEYSPRLTPDGNHINYIHQPPGGYGGQVFMADPDGSYPTAFMEYGPLGYYAFSRDMDQLVVFALSEDGNTLRHVDLRSGTVATTLVSDTQGRALYSAPDHASAYYTQTREDGGFSLHALNFATKATHGVFDLPGLTQDYAVFSTHQAQTQSGPVTALVSVSDEALYYRTLTDVDWTMVADLRDLELTDITRLAVNDDASLIAIVSAETPAAAQ